MSTWIWMFRSSPLQVVNFRNGRKSDIKKKRGKEENVFKEYLFLFLFFSFLLFLLWSGSGTSRKEVLALNSRTDVTSLLVIVFTCFLGSLLSSLTRFTENLSIYLSPPAPNSPLQNPSNFGTTASHWLLYFLLFFFFLIFNRMDAWSLMRGDAFIHFVCGNICVNIRLGVFLLIPKSPQL